MINKYREDMTPEQMMGVAEAIGKVAAGCMKKEDMHRLCAMVFAVMTEGHFDEVWADEAIVKMWYEDEKGRHSAPFFTEDEVKDAFGKRMDDVSDYNIYDFEVAMNLIRSDYHGTIGKYAKTEEAVKDMVADMAVEYLQDADATFPTSKIWHEISDDTNKNTVEKRIKNLFTLQFYIFTEEESIYLQ